MSETLDELENEVTSLKEMINYLLDKDRERIAWRNLVKYYYNDDDIFTEIKIDIENNCTLDEIIKRDKHD